jgi:hypothetical protein
MLSTIREGNFLEWKCHSASSRKQLLPQRSLEFKIFASPPHQQGDQAMIDLNEKDMVRNVIIKKVEEIGSGPLLTDIKAVTGRDVPEYTLGNVIYKKKEEKLEDGSTIKSYYGISDENYEILHQYVTKKAKIVGRFNVKEYYRMTCMPFMTKSIMLGISDFLNSLSDETDSDIRKLRDFHVGSWYGYVLHPRSHGGDPKLIKSVVQIRKCIENPKLLDFVQKWNIAENTVRIVQGKCFFNRGSMTFCGLYNEGHLLRFMGFSHPTINCELGIDGVSMMYLPNTVPYCSRMILLKILNDPDADHLIRKTGKFNIDSIDSSDYVSEPGDLNIKGRLGNEVNDHKPLFYEVLMDYG